MQWAVAHQVFLPSIPTSFAFVSPLAWAWPPFEPSRDVSIRSSDQIRIMLVLVVPFSLSSRIPVCPALPTIYMAIGQARSAPYPLTLCKKRGAQSQVFHDVVLQLASLRFNGNGGHPLLPRRRPARSRAPELAEGSNGGTPAAGRIVPSRTPSGRGLLGGRLDACGEQGSTSASEVK
jgi:hypothetical protein